METQQIIESLSYVTWVLLGGLALGSFALTWLLRQATEATAGFLGFSAILAAVVGCGWLLVEWGLPIPTELAIESGADLDEPRRATIALFTAASLLSGIRLRGGGRALLAGCRGHRGRDSRDVPGRRGMGWRPARSRSRCRCSSWSCLP